MKSLSDLRQAFAAYLKPTDQNCNFYFVKKYDPELYEMVQKNEGMIHTNLLECDKFLRDTLIRFLKSVLAEFPDSEAYMNSLDKQRKPKHYEDAVRKYVRKSVISCDDIAYIRELTNSASHYGEQVEDKVRKITYRSLTNAFSRLQGMMKSYYADKHPADSAELNKIVYRSNYQQIADYVVYNAKTSATASCNAQYMCFRSMNGNQRYYIIREYTTAGQSAIATRENEVLSKLWNDNIEYPQGIVRYNTLETVPCDNPDDARLFVIYEMNGLPINLNKEIISKWDHLMKLRMMTLLCDAVKNLHSMKIYHRNLNLNSVYVYEVNNQYGINLTSFELSKLSVNPANRTVISQVVKNYNPNLVFTAPEIKKEQSEEDYSRINWEKADIYSLGALLTFIISDGAFSSESRKRTNISAIISEYEDEYPDNMIQLLLSMCDENKFKRPDASQVHFIIRRCYEKAREE